MISFVSSSRKRNLVAVLVGVLAALAVTIETSRAGADDECDEVEGTLVERAVPGSDPLQTTGRFKGDIEGDYSFLLTAAVTSQSPNVIHFDGQAEVVTEDGTLSFSDSGALATVGKGNFAYLSTITGGTGEWAGATGQLILEGFFNSTTGRGRGEYEGEVCRLED